MICKRPRRDWLVVRRRRMTRESARSFGLALLYWSVVRSSGGYGVDTSTKVVVESSRAAAGDDDHPSRSRGQRPRKMHSTRGGVHAVDMIDATSCKTSTRHRCATGPRR
jgi:hypothetical protein